MLVGAAWGGQGGRKYDAYKREIEKRMLERDLTEEEAAAELKELKGKDRHAYDVLLDRRRFGGKGGSKYDAYNEEIEKRMVEWGLTREEAVDEMEQKKGKDRHPYNIMTDQRNAGQSRGGGSAAAIATLPQARAVYAAAREELYSVLIAAAEEITPNFNIDEWAQRVQDTTAGKTRLNAFNVHIASVYKNLVKDIPKMKEYPAKPDHHATPQAKASWRTNSTNFLRDELIKRKMLPTFIYWKWTESPAWQRQLMEARDKM